MTWWLWYLAGVGTIAVPWLVVRLVRVRRFLQEYDDHMTDFFYGLPESQRADFTGTMPTERPRKRIKWSL